MEHKSYFPETQSNQLEPRLSGAQINIQSKGFEREQVPKAKSQWKKRDYISEIRPFRKKGRAVHKKTHRSHKVTSPQEAGGGDYRQEKEKEEGEKEEK